MKYKVGCYFNTEKCLQKEIEHFISKLEKVCDLFLYSDIIKEDFDINSLDFFVVFGGDGTLINKARKLIDLKFKNKIICVNCGSLGYHSSLEQNEFNKLISFLKNENIYQTFVEKYYTFSLNNKDVLISDLLILSGNLLNVDLNVNNTIFNNVALSGLILSTNFGTSGYNNSLGGSIVLSSSPLLSIKKIAPIKSTKYQNSFHDLIVDLSENEISIKFDDNIFNCQIYLDGILSKDFEKFKEIDIKVKSFFNLLKFVKNDSNETNYNLKKLL